ncbi:MAG: N-acetyltransferase [Bacteroidales bacterium]|nr:N-acetyltransferase [Bacteroidales bacterium]
MMGYTHCFYTEEESPRMVCAFSLSNSALRTDTLSKRKRNKFNKSIPNTKRRSQYPAILIGQLCVFDGFGHHSIDENVGDEMMDLIKTMAIKPDNDCATRYLVVDALNTPNVLEYYKRNGFEFLFESDEEELQCLRSYDAGKSLFRKIQERCHLAEKQEAPACRTRLMLFDLILLRQ